MIQGKEGQYRLGRTTCKQGSLVIGLPCTRPQGNEQALVPNHPQPRLAKQNDRKHTKNAHDPETDIDRTVERQ